MIRCLILVEGQTEENFVDYVLVPYLARWGIDARATQVRTRQLPSGHVFKGGVTSFGKIKGDLQRLLGDRKAVVTTMLDYFRLPSDTPGVADRLPFATPAARARHICEAIQKSLGHPRLFHAYLSLHEFEALVLSAPAALANVLNAPELAPDLAAIVAGHDTPEAVNDHPDTAPAARIQKVAPDFEKLNGPLALQQAGLPHIRAACPHFDAWVTLLESYGTPPSPLPP